MSKVLSQHIKPLSSPSLLHFTTQAAYAGSLTISILCTQTSRAYDEPMAIKLSTRRIELPKREAFEAICYTGN